MVLATASSIPRECTDEINRFSKMYTFYNSIVALDKTTDLICFLKMIIQKHQKRIKKKAKLSVESI